MNGAGRVVLSFNMSPSTLMYRTTCCIRLSLHPFMYHYLLRLFPEQNSRQISCVHFLLISKFFFRTQNCNCRHAQHQKKKNVNFLNFFFPLVLSPCLLQFFIASNLIYNLSSPAHDEIHRKKETVFE
jgi:hypothetical protein